MLTYTADRKEAKLFLTEFVMMTVACMTSKHQNVTYPYLKLIDCGTLQHILPHSVEQSLISLLSIRVLCTISMLLFHNFISVQF